jgi:hypothetical protein
MNRCVVVLQADARALNFGGCDDCLDDVAVFPRSVDRHLFRRRNTGKDGALDATETSAHATTSGFVYAGSARLSICAIALVMFCAAAGSASSMKMASV